MKGMVLVALIFAATSAQAQDFEKPVRLEAGGKPIATEIGHSAPYVYDFDRDGKYDLLVGQFTGTLMIFRNAGTNEEPRFDGMTLFQAGGETVKVPTG